MEDEVEFIGWADHDGYAWRHEDQAKNYFGEKKQPFSLRPMYAVKCGERHFDENGEEA